ncbi:MAG: hypothetical protein IJ261_04380, partial [Clostridia bacterium]|nr:hypothetical protein [Clostridia bacterium]
GDLMCSSKYETLNGYYYSSCVTLYSDCQAKYIAVTDNSEIDFDREGFESGISELELLNLLEEKGMTVKEFCEDSYYYGPAYREYTVYIVYENVLTKELKIDCIIFLVEEGKFTKYTVTPWSGEEYDSEYDNELAIPDEEHIETAREYMMNYANAFCEEALAGGDMDTCRQKLDAIGAQKAESSVFENYILGDDHLTLSFDESSAYPGKVSFIKAVGLTGAKRYESLSKSEIAEIERKFSIGMSDKELVELLENEELYPASIYENIDYTYNPEKIYKCYSFLLEIGVFDHNGMYDQSCEIRVELYDGAVTNTIVYLDGYTELETTEQYSELDEMWEYLNMYTESEQGMSLAELVDVFEEMSKKPIESVDSEWDGVLFETYEWDGDFVFSLARQIPNGYDDEFYQLHMDVYYSCSDSSYESFSELDWGDSGDANFFKGVRNSQAYTALKDEPIIAVDIYIDGT